MITVDPNGPAGGEIDDIVSLEVKRKPLFVAVPNAVVIEIIPVAPESKTAFIIESDTTEKDKAGIPPKLTEIVPVRCVPLMVMMVP